MKILVNVFAFLSLVLLAIGTSAQSGKSTSAAPNIAGERWDGLFISVSTGAKFARCIHWKRQDGNKVFGALVMGRGETCNARFTTKIEGALTKRAGSWWVIIPEVRTNWSVQSMQLKIQETKIGGQGIYNASWGRAEGKYDMTRKR